MTVTIALVDDHRAVREALREKLSREPDFEVIGDTADVDGALELVRTQQPQLMIVDLGLGKGSGLALLRRLADESRTRALVFSMHNDLNSIESAIRAGAGGFVVKTASGDELLEGIRAIADGGRFFCSEATAALASRVIDPSTNGGTLTPREQSVLKLLAEGHRNPVIAETLHISPGTVEVHRRNIMRKLDLHSVAALTRYAIREGIIPL